jgi:hypothetical protein
MRKFATAGVLTLGLGMWGCSGSGYSSGSPSNPAAPTPMTSNAIVTINVVAINGARKLSARGLRATKSFRDVVTILPTSSDI